MSAVANYKCAACVYNSINLRSVACLGRAHETARAWSLVSKSVQNLKLAAFVDVYTS